jgi:hypothetical protein
LNARNGWNESIGLIARAAAKPKHWVFTCHAQS